MRLVQPADKLLKKLRKFKSDKPIIDGYYRVLKELEKCPSPTEIGERKHGLYANCYAVHITKSHSLVYMYLSKDNVVILIDLDDHKNLYGRDNRA